MTINRRELAISALAIATFCAAPAQASSADEETVAKRVEAFRLAQIAADSKALAALCADELSYSHSSGKVEDKLTFIANATDGKSKFTSLEYKDTWIRVVGPVAIVRFHWVGDGDHDLGPRGGSGYTRAGNLAAAADAVEEFAKSLS